MHRRPVLNRAFWIGAALILLGVTAPAFAQPGVMDNIGNTYKGAATSWTGALQPMAKSIFMKLALLEVAWSAVWWVLEKDDPNQVLIAVLRKIMPLMFFFAILQNFDTWIPAIIDGFTDAGQKAANLPALTPSTVLDRGLEVATTVTDTATKIGLFSKPTQFIMAGLSALGILLCFAVIAGQMLVTLIESYIVVSAGVLFLGFAGSRWTTTFAEKFLSYAVGVGVKLFMTYLIIGAGQSISDQWAATLGTDMQISDYLSILAGALVYMFLAWQIPGLASSMLSGTVSMTLGSAAATAGTMAAGAAGAAGLAQMAATSGANSVAGAFQAGNSAISNAKENGASGFLRVAGGAMGSLASHSAQAAGEAIRGFGSGSSGGNLAERINDSTAATREANAAGTPAPAVPGSQPSAPASGGSPAGGASSTPAGPAAPAAPTAAGSGGTPPPPAAPAAPSAAGAGTQASAGQAATPAATPTSSVIDTSGNVGAAIADRDAGVSGAPAASTGSASGSTESAPEAPAAPAAPAEAPAAGAAAASQPAAPAAPGGQEKEKNEDNRNAMQRLSEHVQALSDMPNDSAAGAGVQINLKHD
jgi:type IV secretion system protein TrbL